MRDSIVFTFPTAQTSLPRGEQQRVETLPVNRKRRLPDTELYVITGDLRGVEASGTNSDAGIA